jgi:hypothetical protein
MHPLKYIRKNRNKLMAIFVVAIMGAFILGDMTCRQLTRVRQNPTLATYGSNQQIKITAEARQQARAELKLLAELLAPQFLASQQDTNLQLLGQLFFHEPGMAERVAKNLKMMLSASGIPVSEATIDDFFRQARAEGDPSDLWILLNAEADSAGVTSTPAEATDILSQVIPQLTKRSLHDFLTMEIQRGNSEESVLYAYSKLVKLFHYAKLKTSQNLVTTNELKTAIKNRAETVDPNCVRIDATVLIDGNSVFPQDQLAKQFSQFKDNQPGDYTDANPYGFGYRLPSRVQLEYLAVKLDDVRAKVDKPTTQEMQAYYQQNTSHFSSEEPDPADPNNPDKKITRLKSYSDAADDISRMLFDEKVQTKTNSVLSDATKIVDRNLEGQYVEKLSDAKYKELAGSYEDAAKAATEKHGIKVYAGRTGMLSSADFSYGKRGHTGSLFIEGRSGDAVSLGKIAFAVAKLDGVELGPFDIQTPRMYENIGPLTDTVTDKLKAVVRVVDAAKDDAPADAGVSYSVAGIRLDEPVSKNDVFSVKEAVTKDLRVMAAMSVAGKMASELSALGAAADWKPLLKTWNTKYAASGSREPFAVKPLGTTRRMTAADIWLETQVIKGRPDYLVERGARLKRSILANRMLDLIKPGETTVGTLPAVVKFEAGHEYYVIKTMSLSDQATTRTYEEGKALRDYYTGVRESQAFAFIHYSPANIKQRMAYKQVENRDVPAETDADR